MNIRELSSRRRSLLVEFLWAQKEILKHIGICIMGLERKWAQRENLRVFLDQNRNVSCVDKFHKDEFVFQ